MNILDCEQGTKEWFDARLGCVTSSRVADAIAVLTRKSGDKKAGDETAGRANLRMELAVELLTKVPSEHYVSKWMENGKKKEWEARAAYSIEKDVYVEQVGFVFHPEIKMGGMSPDGLVDQFGLCELKCPKASTHIRWMIAGVIPKEHRPQMLWQLSCAGGEKHWNAFVSYVPELPKEIRLFTPPRLQMNAEVEAEIRKMESQVVSLNDEVQELLLKLDPEYLTRKLEESIADVQARKAQAEEDSLYITEEDIA